MHSDVLGALVSFLNWVDHANRNAKRPLLVHQLLSFQTQAIRQKLLEILAEDSRVAHAVLCLQKVRIPSYIFYSYRNLSHFHELGL